MAPTAPRDAPGEERVLGLDNVPLDLPIARAGSRVLAAFLDYLVVLLAAVAWVFACLGLYAWLHLAVGWAVALGLIGLFVLDYGYFAGSEVGWKGKTFGKWALDLRVATRHGGQAGTAALLIRNAVRTVDLVTGVPLMIFDPLAQRLGDRLAGTVVLHEPRRGAEIVMGRVPGPWGAREVALLESFLERSAEMEPWRSQRLARRFLDWIERDDPRLLEGSLRSDDPALDLKRAVQLSER